MNLPPLQLDDFCITRLNVNWRGQNLESPGTELQCTFGYDVGVNNTDDTVYKFDLRLQFQEKDAKDQNTGYSIEADLTGFFRFPPETDKSTRETVIRINGVSMLYSTFRGVLAGITGIFPPGKLTLPSILPHSIVKDVEEKRTQKSATTTPATP